MILCLNATETRSIAVTHGWFGANKQLHGTLSGSRTERDSMPGNSLDAELEAEELECTARIRAAIEEYHEPLLRSIAVLVAKTGRGLRWPEVMEMATEILHEAVQEALKHADRFDPTRSATAWLRGIAARLLFEPPPRRSTERGASFPRPLWESRPG